jgi:hypothetical protein
LTTESLKYLPSELVNTRTMKPQVAFQRVMDTTVLEENSHRTPTVPGHHLEDLLRAVTVPVAPVVVAALLVMAMLVAEAAAVGAPHTGLAGELVAEAAAAGAPHTGLAGELVAEAIAGAEATQTATSPVSHAAAMMPAAESR